MKLLMPPTPLRREIDASLASFFDTEDMHYFREALTKLSAFYKIKRPRIVWSRMKNPKNAGYTEWDGTICLIPPGYWKKHRKYNQPKKWRRTFYHEFWHHYSWSNNEPKAEMYEARFVRDL